MPSFSSACFKLFLNLKSLPESLFEEVFHCFAMLFTDSPCQYLNINKACSFLLRVNNHLLIIGVISSSSYSVSVCGTDNISSISLKRISIPAFLFEYGFSSIYQVFYPQLGVKLCSMAGGGVQKIYMVFLREPSRRDRSGSDLFHLWDGFEIKMNFDRNVSCFIFVNALMHDDFFD